MFTGLVRGRRLNGSGAWIAAAAVAVCGACRPPIPGG